MIGIESRTEILDRAHILTTRELGPFPSEGPAHFGLKAVFFSTIPLFLYKSFFDDFFTREKYEPGSFVTLGLIFFATFLWQWLRRNRWYNCEHEHRLRLGITPKPIEKI